jgi:hypothetical protein
MEQPVAELKRQLAEFEQRFMARESSRESSRLEAIEPQLNQLLHKESSRLDAIERQLHQLSGQLAQLSILVNQQPKSESSRPFVPEVKQEVKQAEAVTSTAPPAEIDDPLLNRLSAFLDDF